jgi:hypothetical protein
VPSTIVAEKKFFKHVRTKEWTKLAIRGRKMYGQIGRKNRRADQGSSTRLG